MDENKLLEMFKLREDILMALEEGILAIDKNKKVIFINKSAIPMLHITESEPIGKDLNEIYPASRLGELLTTGKKEFNVQMKSLKNDYVISDRMPIYDNGEIVGAFAIFRNRTEVVQLAENLTGVKHLVESMRANNHDFVNKLHVILGLIQMKKYDEAVEYIMNVSMVQKEIISTIIKQIKIPSIAALLIGKFSRASELGIHFALDSSSSLEENDTRIPSDVFITVLGNLIENAMDSLNSTDVSNKKIYVSILSTPKEIKIVVSDNGNGIKKSNLKKIFKNGFSTKSNSRGTGLFVVKSLIETYNGKISVTSEMEIETKFTVKFKKEGK